jgi:response regulator RpfG family c-di-GMP phosphodiesterase
MKILIVDDEDDVLKSLKKGLENICGTYEIKTAKDGNKCLNILNEEIPDLILLDLLMPNMNGWEVWNILKENIKWRDIPIFIITAVDDPEFKKNAEDLDIVYIEKPFSMTEIKNKIDNYFK